MNPFIVIGAAATGYEVAKYIKNRLTRNKPSPTIDNANVEKPGDDNTGEAENGENDVKSAIRDSGSRRGSKLDTGGGNSESDQSTEPVVKDDNSDNSGNEGDTNENDGTAEKHVDGGGGSNGGSRSDSAV